MGTNLKSMWLRTNDWAVSLRKKRIEIFSFTIEKNTVYSNPLVEIVKMFIRTNRQSLSSSSRVNNTQNSSATPGFAHSLQVIPFDPAEILDVLSYPVKAFERDSGLRLRGNVLVVLIRWVGRNNIKQLIFAYCLFAEFFGNWLIPYPHLVCNLHVQRISLHICTFGNLAYCRMHRAQFHCTHRNTLGLVPGSIHLSSGNVEGTKPPC